MFRVVGLSTNCYELGYYFFFKKIRRDVKEEKKEKKKREKIDFWVE